MSPHPLLPCVTSRSGAGQGAPVSTLLSPKGRGFFLTSHPPSTTAPRGRCWNLDMDSPPTGSLSGPPQRAADSWSDRLRALPLEPSPGWALPLELRPREASQGARIQAAQPGLGGEGKEASPEAPEAPPEAPTLLAAPRNPMGGPSCPHSSVLKVTLPHCPKDSSQIPPELRRASFSGAKIQLFCGILLRISKQNHYSSFFLSCSQLSNVLIIFCGLGPQD